MTEKLILPRHIENALNLIETNGFEAFVVGGAVRDALLGKTPGDWDIATNAKTDNIKSIFKKHFNTGERHGTITAIVDGLPIEITTYRTDGRYKDFRRPESVQFTNKLHKDLLRRDFTVNALAYNHDKGLIDICGGRKDLKSKQIRCIGNAREKLAEDALRVLRALRFASVLNFEIERETYNAVCECAVLLNRISAERITAELTQILTAQKKIELLFKTGIADIILPEVAECFCVYQGNCKQCGNVGNHIIKAVYNVPKTTAFLYSALLHDIGKAKTKKAERHGNCIFPGHAKISAEMAKGILARLKMNKKDTKRIVTLIRLHEIKIRPGKKSVRRLAAIIGRETFCDLLLFKKANALAHGGKYAEKQITQLKKIEKIYLNDLKNNIPLSIKDLAVNGFDLKKIGFQGHEIGEMLKWLLFRVIENPKLNTKEKMINAVKRRNMQKKDEQLLL